MNKRYRLIFYPNNVFIGGRIYPAPLGFPINGNIKVTYVSDIEVVQIAPIYVIPIDTTLKNIINRWIGDAMEQLILSETVINKFNEVVIKINSEKNSDFTIVIPKIISKDCGSFIDRTTEFPFIVFEKFDCDSENNQIPLNNIDLMKSLLKLLIVIHNQSFSNQNSDLRLYYRKRLGYIIINLKKILGENVLDDKNILKQLLNIAIFFSDNIDRLILHTEQISYLHGDFQISNILVNTRKKEIALIDFEQGLHGGDWLMDLWKIGYFGLKETFCSKKVNDNFFINPLVDYYYRLRFDLNSLFDYLNPAEMEQRIELVRFDTFVSTLILRYRMNWLFDELTLPDGRQFRGVKFILKLLNQQVPRVLNNKTKKQFFL